MGHAEIVKSPHPLENWLTQDESLPADATRFVGLDELGKGLLLSVIRQRSSSPILSVFGSKFEARNAVDNFCFFAGKQHVNKVHYLPPVDFDFYRGILPSPELLNERNVALFQAINDPNGRVFITTLEALLQKVFPPQEFLRATRVLSPNDEVQRDTLILGLLEAGYQRQPAAYDPGVFAVRGGVIDIFCPLYKSPFRLEFFGDFIEEMRFFEPQSQRSLEKLDKAFVLPVGQSLVPHGDDYEEAAVKIKERLDFLGIPKSHREEILEEIKGGVLSTEMSFLFPLLSRGSTPLLDYFPKHTQCFWDGEEKLIGLAEEKEFPKIAKNFALFEKAPIPIAKDNDLFLTPSELESLFSKSPRYFFESFTSGESNEFLIKSETFSFSSERETMKHSTTSHPLLDSFARRFKNWIDEGYRIQVISHTHTHTERFQQLFEPYGLRTTIHEEGTATFTDILKTDFRVLNLWQGYITQSQVFPLLRVVILSEEEIFGQKKRALRSSAWVTGTDVSRAISSFRDLKVNDYVVHKDHGIGRYLGLKSMNFLGSPNDYVLLEYKDGDKLYIPVYRLNVLQKYVGGEGATAALDKLGGERWSKVKQKAQKAVAELAAEFLKTHAKRKLMAAFKCTEPDQDYHQFEMEFPFDETPDQLKSIDDVTADLGQSHPMDRLICGDVGYGKTEVAMRAAFRVASNGKQVSILVPTTVLAFQHYETFKQRFKNTPLNIEMVSRLRATSEIKETLAKLKAGKVDIIIGTHRLLSSDVMFQDLALVIVDEEHRFGVVHKERLKTLCESVHLLAMTATPIPRTLNMAMTGIKDISIITTPPPDRLSVRTFVSRYSPEIIVEAVTNELVRSGQVFFVHNRIESIYRVADELRQLLPKVKIEIVHGQVDGETLEKKMLAFYRGEFDLLLTTAIIESGLDIPRANTIIIDDADHFGLAQLYQLRGRVGRSERRAYCYLLVPGENVLTADAKQRLQVIQRYTDLGSGFSIASHDLEIRGAGDLLGKEQSGHLNAVGIDLYFELLEESMQELRGQPKKIEIEPEINLRIAAFFPENYLPDISERIAIYRRLASVENEEAISEIETEVRDRFGTLPTEVINFLGLMKIKLHLKKLHVVRMSCGPKKTSLQFAPSTPASPAKLVRLIETNPTRYSLTPDQKLVFSAEDTDWRNLLREIQSLSAQLGVEGHKVEVAHHL